MVNAIILLSFNDTNIKINNTLPVHILEMALILNFYDLHRIWYLDSTAPKMGKEIMFR